MREHYIGVNAGIMRSVYVVRNRKSGEVAFVELGARYNQREWELLRPVDTTAIEEVLDE